MDLSKNLSTDGEQFTGATATLSRRDEFARTALHGLLTGGQFGHMLRQTLVEESVRIADYIIAELDRP